jgi:hypothetical protein
MRDGRQTSIFSLSSSSLLDVKFAAGLDPDFAVHASVYGKVPPLPQWLLLSLTRSCHNISWLRIPLRIPLTYAQVHGHGLLSALASSTVMRTEKSRRCVLTWNEHHRKLRMLICDNFDWLVNADVSDFCPPPCRVLAMYSAWKITPPFRNSTITFCLPRLPAASHDYLLLPTTTCCLPRLPAASHDYLLPPTTTCCLPRLPAASHDYLLPRYNKEKHPLILSTLL